jgi:GT2 family glycosyltransferase
MDGKPQISFLIAVDDHPPDLDRFFGRLIGQTLAPGDYECIVVDSSHTHDYAPAYGRALQRKPENMRLHYEVTAKGGRAGAYNRGLVLCRAPIILFSGDDNLPGHRAAEIHLRFHREHPERHFVGVGSSLLPEELRTHFSVWSEQSGELYGVPFSKDMTSVPDSFFYAGNTSIKHEFLREAGPFDENFRFHAWDDFEMGLRLGKLGMKSVYLPEATAEHVHDLPLEERCRAMVNAGQGAAAFDRKYAGRHPWQAKCRLPPWWHRTKARWSRLKFAMLGRDSDLTAYYRRTLDASFVAGYREAAGPAVTASSNRSAR